MGKFEQAINKKVKFYSIFTLEMYVIIILAATRYAPDLEEVKTELDAFIQRNGLEKQEGYKPPKKFNCGHCKIKNMDGQQLVLRVVLDCVSAMSAPRNQMFCTNPGAIMY